jgi:hypothetical protein
MEAKKKASELVLGYLAILGHQPKEAKESALFTVEQILKEISLLPLGYDFKIRRDYWELVREEIKLIKFR